MLRVLPFIVLIALSRPAAAQSPVSPQAPTSQDAKQDPLNKVVCKTEETIGTRLGAHKVCATVASGASGSRLTGKHWNTTDEPVSHTESRSARIANAPMKYYTDDMTKAGIRMSAFHPLRTLEVGSPDHADPLRAGGLDSDNDAPLVVRVNASGLSVSPHYCGCHP